MDLSVRLRQFQRAPFRALSLLALLFACSSSAPAASNGKKGYFWHVTDFHMDVNYSTSGNAMSMCWNVGDSSGLPPGPYGDYHCDSPYKLVQAAVNGMKKLEAKPDFILWTGDDKAHVPDTNFDDDIVYDIVKNITETLSEGFPNVSLVPVLGNHDWFPTHQLPDGESPLYKRIGTLWKPWIKDEGYATFKTGGYYTLVLPNGVRFVVLNTAIYYNKNLTPQLDEDDPSGQYVWFDQVMTNFSNLNQKVYVTSHVPIGVFERHMTGPKGFSWLKPEANQKFIELFVKHSKSIMGMFFAHHHTDSFRVIYNDAGAPVNWMLIAPAVTPWNTTLSQVGPNNPGLRQIAYDVDTQAIHTFKQYYLNLTEANAKGTTDWVLEYDAQDVYDLGPDGITPQTLDRLAQTFNTPNRTYFDPYYYYNSVSYQSASECDAQCQHYQYCAITRVDYEAFEKCRGNAGNPAKGQK